MSSDPGKYELICKLASGGMAEVHLARMRGVAGFEKLVVIKRPLPALAAHPTIAQMLLDEARIAATLDHTNVAHVLDVEIVDGAPFLVMEFLHGQDLKRLLGRARKVDGRVPLEQAMTVLLGVCAGLHYAHDKRASDGRPLAIVHRDVSPQNVFVPYDGGVKVIDFGIAKARNKLARTEHGTLKGKFSYMSPEQCECDEIDRTSDVFSLGVVAYEMLLGRKPFFGDTDFAVMKSIVEQDPVAPLEIDPDFDPELQAILLKALRKKREDRYPTTRAMQQALDAWARARGIAPSQFSLAAYMERLFAEELEVWRSAETAGATLADHIRTTSSGAGRAAPSEMAPRPQPGATPPSSGATVAASRATRRSHWAVVVAAVALAASMAAWVASLGTPAPLPPAAAVSAVPAPEAAASPPASPTAPTEEAASPESASKKPLLRPPTPNAKTRKTADRDALLPR